MATPRPRDEQTEIRAEMKRYHEERATLATGTGERTKGDITT